MIIDEVSALKDEIVILGYFTLTMKTLKFNPELSKTKIKRIDGFSKDIQAAEAILIGQLGKNSNFANSIDGKTLMDYAIETVYKVHSLAGGRIVFLECQDTPKIVDFYSENGFEALQKSDEGGYLQMIRFL